MERQIRPGSFPFQVLAFLVVPLLFLLMVLAFGSNALHRDAMRNLVAEQDIRAIKGAADSLSERLDQQHTILAVLRDRVERGEEPQAVIASLGDLPETIFDGGMAFYDGQGRILAASPESVGWQNAREIVTALGDVETEDEVIYLPLGAQNQNISQIAIISVAYINDPVQTVSAVRVVGVVSIDSLGLTDVLDSLHVPSAAVFIASPDGLILYHNDPERVGRYILSDSHTAIALEGNIGASFNTIPDDGKILTVYAPIHAPGWRLIQEQYWIETVNPLMRYSNATPLILLPGLVLAVSAVFFGIRQIMEPLKELEVRASDLAGGDYSSIKKSVGGINEIRRLQGTLQEMASRVQAAQTGMRYYIGAITNAQEEERSRLSRELHDHMIQSLIALDHREQLMKRHLTDSPEGLLLLTELRQMIAQAIEDLRRIIRAMRPIFLEELGLVPALEMLARDVNADQSLTVSFDEVGDPRRLASDHEIVLYRVTQEALNNVRRHSDASQIWLTVCFEPDEVILSIRDDGQGFIVPRRMTELSGKGHFGLVGMFERATLIGARLQIQSEPGQGTTVIIKTPTSAPLST